MYVYVVIKIQLLKGERHSTETEEMVSALLRSTDVVLIIPPLVCVCAFVCVPGNTECQRILLYNDPVYGVCFMCGV